MGAARKGSETSWGALEKARRFWLSIGARHGRLTALPLFKIQYCPEPAWQPPEDSETAGELDGCGRQVELGGRALPAIQNSISPEKAQKLPGTAEAVGEPIRGLDGFGRQLELGAPG